MARRRSPAVTSVPILPVADMTTAAEFYRRLGFSVEAFDAGYAFVGHGGHELFHLRVAGGLDANDNPAACYLHVADAGNWHSTWSNDGVSITPVEDEPWGMREFSLRDPSGNLIRVGHNL